MLCAGASYHKSCFTCETCNTRLDSTTVTNKGQQIYCKACYGKAHGPKGYGYGQGAGTLVNTGGSAPPAVPMAPQVSEEAAAGPLPAAAATAATTAKPAPGSDICPKCLKKVYMMEKILAIGHSWHKACAVCVECKKCLDSTNMLDGEGSLFCKACYNRVRGPKVLVSFVLASLCNFITTGVSGRRRWWHRAYPMSFFSTSSPLGSGCRGCRGCQVVKTKREK
jgi:cysteine/glycine-rich protein